MTDDDSLANSSLSTSRVPPQDGQKPDSMPTTRTLPGNDHQKGLESAEPDGPSRKGKSPLGSGSVGKQHR